MSIEKAEIAKARDEIWLDTLKERLKNFYNNEVVEDSVTADEQLRKSCAEMKKAYAESVTILDEIFP